ncbi:uncharacterized protein LOC108995631 isoform X2 [Juglans regia]|uniref:Uncharacterized protein LOC108995631 isoform X2 n=1 Tax=Juglans regia TaxID=51240 RepID=A0A6P9EDT9_JUGRE|nr:uncharacterized protein LOC108995631 isoform X2 [Juglans regia]
MMHLLMMTHLAMTMVTPVVSLSIICMRSRMMMMMTAHDLNFQSRERWMTCKCRHNPYWSKRCWFISLTKIKGGMWHSVKGGRRGRGGHSRAESSARSWKDAQGLPPRRNLHDKEATFSNESTQAVAAATFSNESTQAVAVEPVQESTVVAQGGEGNISTVPAIKKRGRGPARGTQFDRLRKVGKIPLVIKDGHRGPSCEHASIFTGRVTWIVKVYADMRHASWSCVPEEEKQELIDRVRADFVLDWTKDNHKEMVITYLSDKYNHYHYELHKVYLKYASHEEALRGGT